MGIGSAVPVPLHQPEAPRNPIFLYLEGGGFAGEALHSRKSGERGSRKKR